MADAVDAVDDRLDTEPSAEPPPARDVITEEAAAVLDRLRPPDPELEADPGPSALEVAKRACGLAGVNPYETVVPEPDRERRLRRTLDLADDVPITNLDVAYFEAMNVKAEVYWRDDLDRQAVREGWRSFKGHDIPKDRDRYELWRIGRELFEPGYQRPPDPVRGPRRMVEVVGDRVDLNKLMDEAIRGAFESIKHAPPGTTANPADFIEP